MGPQSLPPLASPTKRSYNLWIVATLVFAVGIGGGIFLPSGFNVLNRGEPESKTFASKKESLTLTLPNGRLRQINPVPSIAAKPVAVEVRKEKIKKTDARLEKKSKLIAKNDKPAAKLEKSASGTQSLAIDKSVPSVSIETVRAAPSASPDRFSSTLVKSRKSIARPVSLPPSQELVFPETATPLPMVKAEPKVESKTYPVSINNASFSKTTLADCPKRCALLGMDASGHPIRAVFDGPTFAAALLQHSGTINISGQPRIIKNQQVLVIENITFNLSPIQKTAKRSRTPTGAPVLPVADRGGYTEVSFDNDDLKPGTVIKNRKQIPVDVQQEIPLP